MNHAYRKKLGAGPTVLEHVGTSTLAHLEYIGGLTMQLKAAVGSLSKALPLLGNRLRWRAALERAGYSEIRIRLLEHEGGIITARRPVRARREPRWRRRRTGAVRTVGQPSARR